MLKVNELRTFEQHLWVNGGVAVVSVRTHVSGTYAGNQADGDFRFTRVWALSSDSTWRVVAAHSTVVA
jgi:ketosteroid isomerase-like protein